MEVFMNINIVYSESHYFFPKIVIGIIVFLSAIILIQKIFEIVKDKKSGVEKKTFRFFEPGFDKVKLFGSLALFIGYVACLKPLGFLLASIIFVFLFNVLFCATLKLKSLLISAAVSVISSTTVWYLFGVVFRITLP